MNKKEPPSKFEPQEDEKAPEFTHGLLILADDNLSHIQLVYEFEHQGKAYTTVRETLRLLISTVNSNLERNQLAQTMVEKLINMPIPVQTPGGTVEINLPQLIAKMSAEMTATELLKQKVMADPRLIIPGHKPS
jgi:hypothetical protein